MLMKTISLILVIFLFFNLFAKSNTNVNVDSLEKRVQVIEKKFIEDEKEDEEENLMLMSNQPLNTEKKVKIIKNKNCYQTNIIKTLPLSNKILVLSPLFTLGLFFLITCLFLKRRGFSLTQALSSKRTNEQGQTEYLPSASKLLAFFSVMFGLIFVAFFFTFYFFMAFKRLPLPSFIGLWPLVFILGLGILPYIVQMIFKK